MASEAPAEPPHTPRARHALNRASYDAIAADWDGARRHLNAKESRYLGLLVAGLAPGASILDLGCGSGRPIAAHLLGIGYRLTGVDQAAALLALAHTRHPQAQWIEAAIEGFETARRFDAIVCWDALFHIERSLHAGLLARWYGMLGRRGRLMLTLGGSASAPFVDTMFGRAFFYDSHPPATALELLVRAGFRPLLAEYLELPTGGRHKGRYGVIAERE
jgi:2-polyprenyl-3-methyl-5-hydroxy-6-metoxy-1,4-benzoquinol methylase